ncbi:MAG: hypothetical protein V9G19_14815 [Tetrasphaera sp.]
MRRRGSFLVWLVLLGVMGALPVTPASAAGVRWGNTLRNGDGSVKQPQNAPRVCDSGGPLAGQPCTMVSVLTSNTGHEKAPKDGTIKRVRVVAAHAGSFRLFFAKAKPGAKQARIVKRGPVISFAGDDTAPYTIETKAVSISVKKGWYLAARASSFETVTCFSGSPAQLEFQPPLAVGAPFATADDTNGCYLLVQLEYA